MEVTIIGCGYVGLVTGVCLASIGHTVRGVEKDPRKLKSLQEGHCPLFEPGLQELMNEVIGNGSESERATSPRSSWVWPAARR